LQEEETHSQEGGTTEMSHSADHSPTPTSTKPLVGAGRVSENDLEKAVVLARARTKGEDSLKEADEETPQMNVISTLILLVAVAVLVSVTAEWLVDSISGLTASGAISEEFVGVILLPIVGNAAEHVTAVTVSVKDKLTLSMSVAIGSTLQIALFVIPFIVSLAWWMDKPLTLLFDPYESITLFLAVLTVNYSIQDGKSNWLEGMILMCLYLILCVTFWYYPGKYLPLYSEILMLTCLINDAGSNPLLVLTQKCH
jgi:Ca2+:H+ antiporter